MRPWTNTAKISPTIPVGTGPFKMVEFNPSSKVVWDRNPTFRTEVYPSDGGPGDKEAGLLVDAGKTLPRVDRIVTECTRNCSRCG